VCLSRSGGGRWRSVLIPQTSITATTSADSDTSILDQTPVDYSQPVSTVTWSSGRFRAFSANLDGLSDGSDYSVGVRSFNMVGEESNTIAVSVTADGTPPALVDSFVAIATNQDT
jgi:hypothetical protein